MGLVIKAGAGTGIETGREFSRVTQEISGLLFSIQCSQFSEHSTTIHAFCKSSLIVCIIAHYIKCKMKKCQLIQYKMTIII